MEREFHNLRWNEPCCKGWRDDCPISDPLPQIRFDSGQEQRDLRRLELAELEDYTETKGLMG